MNSINDQKSSLRQALLKHRKTQNETEKNYYNQLINKHILSYFEPAKSTIIGAYLAWDGEPDIGDALHELHQNGHRIAVPVISKNRAGSMQFFDWRPDLELHTNRYGIPEPVSGKDQQPIEPADLNALLIPLLGFDAAGHRLGMGAGFYDRWLAGADEQRPQRIGIAYAWQQQAHIPFDTMDQPLHRVITGHGVIECHSAH